MRIITIFLLTCLAGGAAQAASLPSEVVENLDQYRIVLSIGDERIKAMPAWRPGEGKPPMSLEAAVARTLEWIESKALLKDATIYELKYKPVHNYETLDRWYYLVELRMRDGMKRFLAVLPDGQVVPAIAEPGR
jgi:hypothetical protein